MKTTKKEPAGKMPSSKFESFERVRQYKFYKYRTIHSWGKTEWKIVRLPLGETVRSFFDGMSRDNSYSEKYSGLEWKKISPPKEWLETEILRLREQSHYLTQLADDYCWILDELESKEDDYCWILDELESK